MQEQNYFNISNRRYIGSKAKLGEWIFQNLDLSDIKSVCDIFAGSGVVASKFVEISHIKKIIINDFLYSNEVIYNSFFNSPNADLNKLNELKNFYNNSVALKKNYFSENFSDKFFSNGDCLKIGSIREHIALSKFDKTTENILLTSLIYSMDKIANTVGHYEAYRKNESPKDRFEFDLILPIKHNKTIEIHRENANHRARKSKTDLVCIDPPDNSRQYSRFYHVYENLIQWKKPKLNGTALKPPPENMSNYCRSSAVKELDDLVANLDCKQIALTYNNTYNSKSSSSQNKISFEQIEQILSKKGKLSIKEKSHNYFNAGKTELNGHKEFLFIVKVKK